MPRGAWNRVVIVCGSFGKGLHGRIGFHPPGFKEARRLALRTEDAVDAEVEFDTVLKRAANYLPAERLEAVREAYEFAAKFADARELADA